MACLTVIFPIVDLRQCCACCTRSGVTRCSQFVELYLWQLCASPRYTRCFDRTSVYLCASPLQNLAVPHDFYYPLSISLERSGWPRIRWCGIRGFQEQVQCFFVGLVAFSFFYLQLFSLSLLFLYRLLVWGWGLRTDRVSISLSRLCISHLF